MVLDINLIDEEFNITVTGLDHAGQPFRYEQEAIKFQPGYAYSENALDLYMGNNYPAIVAGNIDYVKITDAP